jgi:hypothetical protein
MFSYQEGADGVKNDFFDRASFVDDEMITHFLGRQVAWRYPHYLRNTKLPTLYNIIWHKNKVLVANVLSHTRLNIGFTRV